jgi:medium-chain acyl-[acyl-carrier-protein] hydrolase
MDRPAPAQRAVTSPVTPDARSRKGVLHPVRGNVDTLTAAMQAGDDSARWFKRPRRGRTSDVRLFCFHHAGGTAALYREWPQLLPTVIAPVAVQLPGRADRFREPPFETMAQLLDELIEVIGPLLDQPFAFYGLSMGARVSWALAHHLRSRQLPMPAALYLASVAAPGCEEGRADWDVGKEDLLRYLRTMGGTPPELFSEPELLASLLPTLRADLTVVDSFRFRPPRPLDLPIRAFAGLDDAEGPPDRMRGWRAETRGRFDLDVVPGGHFFNAAGELQVIRTITDDLLRELAGPEVVNAP